MKKLDLHIHTVATISDVDFIFDLSKLIRYVETQKLDGIAITNHNCFDMNQYNDIRNALNIPVLPGIEINLGKGHMLLIANDTELTDFNSKCLAVTNSISSKELINIFGDLSKYLLIPHYDKKPKIEEQTIEELKEHIICGEVNSVKKFIYNQKKEESLVPVYFSDVRISQDINNYPVRQTFFNLEDININSLKICLRDKNKVSLTRKDGYELFQALPSGLEISTGLNVIIGERSSGKSYTLEQINKTYDNIKYIRQFELLETQPEKAEERFTDKINIQQSEITRDYLKEFSSVVDDVKRISITDDDDKLETYLTSLVSYAIESEKADAFSNCSLYTESYYQENNLKNLQILIKSTTNLLESTEYKEIINKFIDEETLKGMLLALITEFNNKKQVILKKRWINDLVRNIKNDLQSRTAAPRVPEIDFLDIQRNRIKVEKFSEIVNGLQRKRNIFKKDLDRFTIEAFTEKFTGAQELKKISGTRSRFSNAFRGYGNPYEFLQELRKIEGIEETTFYKYYVKIDFKILNEHGFFVSGGERAEFNLLQEINDAYHYDMLLIDEPESSFDNLFLKDHVNQLIKLISLDMPVVVVTHNSTVGASIDPDYIIYTKRLINGKNIVYETFTGFPSSKELKSVDGKTIKNLDITLDCLEAGENTYKERRSLYEMLED